MLWSALFAFGSGLLVALGSGNGVFLRLCGANFISSGCWHVINLRMDGTAVGAAGNCCCWIDRVCVAVTVIFGVKLALSQGLWLSSLAGILVPILYTIKSTIPRRERYIRTLVHCVMHQVGVLGGLVWAAVALPAASHEALREPWWDWVMAFMWAVIVVVRTQPTLTAPRFPGNISERLLVFSAAGGRLVGV